MIWIDIEQWARQHLPTTRLSRVTLISYAKSGQFQPPARKIGRRWHVGQDAQLITNQHTAIQHVAIADPIVAKIFASV